MPIRRLRIDLKRVLANAVILPGGRRALREEVIRDLEERGIAYEGDGWWRGDPNLLNADEVLQVQEPPEVPGEGR